MSDWNGFGSLDLSNVEASGGSTRLQPGTYTVKCSDAKVEAIGETKNRKLVADFVDVDGSGDIRVNFNIVHTSDQAQEIGRRQLKSFLIAANHPNPDKPIHYMNSQVALNIDPECAKALGSRFWQ